MRSLRLALLAPALLIGGCGGSDDTDPGGISAGEAQELNEAAAMLDANAIELNAVESEPGTGGNAR